MRGESQVSNRWDDPFPDYLDGGDFVGVGHVEYGLIYPDLGEAPT